MPKFVLTAELQLNSPKNVQQVVDKLSKQLGGVAVNVSVQNSAQAVKQINAVTDATKKAAHAADEMGASFGVSLKRFTAFSLASRAIGLVTRRLANAIDEAVDFNSQMIKISQVTEKTLSDLSPLSKEINRLAKTWGVASKEIVNTALILAQAGLSANDTKIALEALTKTQLSATFGDINETAEGAVALLAQFGEGAAALERQLGAVNTVAAKFAVESEDLIEVIRRTGGVFRSSGGSLEELLALFTSVRATTRENAESIATALKTIFTRIQRPQTIAYLKELGVSLVDLEGNFVGPYEAMRRLSEAFGDLPAGDLKFIRIAEQLGGYRQIGKVIPLLQQFATAEKARQVALSGSDSLTRDAIIAQDSLAVQLTKTKEQYIGLIRSLTETGTFQVLVKTTLSLANAFVQVAESIKPILPLIGAFAAFKASQGIGTFLGGVGRGFSGVKTKNSGGRIGFNSGGLVPGTGNRDTVPAMLTPGEFVIKKSSVESIGAGNLHSVNKYAQGGTVLGESQLGMVVADKIPTTGTKQGQAQLNKLDIFKKASGSGVNKALTQTYAPLKETELDALAQQHITPYREAFAGASSKPYAMDVEGITSAQAESLTKIAQHNVAKAFARSAEMWVKDANGLGIKNSSYSASKAVKDAKAINFKVNSGLSGVLFENVLRTLNGEPLRSESNDSDETGPFDFTRGLPLSTIGSSNLFKGVRDKGINYIDAKLSGGTNIQPKAFETKLLNQAIVDMYSLIGSPEGADMRAALPKPNSSRANSNFKPPAGGNAAKALASQPPPRRGFAAGGSVGRRNLAKRAYVFDFDDTLGVTDSKVTTGADAFAQFRGPQAGENIKNARATRYAAMAKKRAQMGYDIHVLTARPSESYTVDAIREFFLKHIGVPPKSVVGTAMMFEGEREPGKKPGTTRKITTPAKKARVLAQLAAMYEQIIFLDDDAENIAHAKGVSGVKTLKVPRENHFNRGGTPSGSSSDTVPALLTPGEFVINKESAQQIGYSNLHRMNKNGAAGFNKGGFVKFNGGTGPNGVIESQKGLGGIDKSVATLLAISAIAPTFTQLAGETTEMGKTLNRVTSFMLTFGTVMLATSSSMKRVTDAATLASEKIKAINLAKSEVASSQAVIDKLKNRAGGRGGREIAFAENVLQNAPAKGAELKSRREKLVGFLSKNSPDSADVPAVAALNKEIIVYNKAVRQARVFLEPYNKQLAIQAKHTETLKQTVTRSERFSASIGGMATKLAGATTLVFALTAAVQSYMQSLADEAGFRKEQAVKNKDFAKAYKEAETQSSIQKATNIGGSIAGYAGTGVAIGGTIGFFAGGPVGAAVGAAIGGVTVGLYGAYQEFFNGATKRAQEESKKARELLDIAEAELDFDTSKIFKNKLLFASDRSKAAADIGAASGKFAARLGDKNLTDTERETATELARQKFGDLVKSVAQNVQTQAELESALQSMKQVVGFTDAELRKLAQTTFAAKQYLEQLAQLNVDNLLISSAFASAASAAETFSMKLTSGFNQFEALSKQIDLSLNSIGQTGDSLAAINKAETEIFKTLGIARGSKLGSAVQGSADSTRLIAEFNSKVAPKLSGLQVKVNQGASAKADVQAALEEIVPTSGSAKDQDLLRKAISSAFSDLNPEDNDVDLSKILENVFNKVKPSSEPFITAMKHSAAVTNMLTDATKRRIDSENKFAETQKANIDVMIEGAQAIADFSGQVLKPATVFSGKLAQFNNFAGLAGVGKLQTGSASEISDAANVIASRFKQVQRVKSSNPDAFAGTNVDKDTRDRLVSANAELVNLARARITQIKQEIDLINKKNQLEKSSLEKLLGGDTAGFLKEQAGAAAAAALRSGSGLASIFSASSLGLGFKQLQSEEGVDPDALEKAAKVALAAYGVGGARASQILSDNAPETRGLRAEGQRTGQALIGAAEASTRMGYVSLQANIVEFKNLQITIAKGLNSAAGSFNGGASSTVAQGGITTQGSTQSPISEASVTGFANSSQQLVAGFNTFSSAVEKINSLQGLTVTHSIAPMNVNLNFNGASFLSSLNEVVKEQVVEAIKSEIVKYKARPGGNLERSTGVV